MKEGGLDEKGLTRRDLFRRGGEVALGASAAAVGLTESARAEKADEYIEPPPDTKLSAVRALAEPQVREGDMFTENTKAFVALLDRTYKQFPQQDGPSELADALMTAEGEYVNRYCEDGGIERGELTRAIAGQAMFDAYTCALQIQDVDPRILTALFQSTREKLNAASQESTQYARPGKPLDLLDPNSRQA